MYNTIDCFERTKNMNLLSLSPAEAEIMELLWEGGEKTNRELLFYLNTDGRDWKRQTLNTLLTRLIAKNLVKKNGHKFMAEISKQEYNSAQAQSVLETMYNGSLDNFIMTLNGGNQLSEEEAATLRKLLNEKDGEKE